MNRESSSSYCEMDHTILDIQIESSDSGAKVEAIRPYLIVCTDSWSRRVLTFNLCGRPLDQETMKGEAE